VNFIRYYHTLRHLRLRQILGRVWFKLHRPKPDLRPAPPPRAPRGIKWTRIPLRQPLMLSPTRFRLLNEEYDIQSSQDWNSPHRKFLWNLNLHYFEDLIAEDAETRREWHQELIERWIAENRPGKGLGWEPYPLSLRICNWIKWALAGHELSARGQGSLAVQARYLRKRYDYHLLGNHLLVNAKAFIFAGLFFDGVEARSWLEKGMAILRRQIPEQILPDGGHIERSPMYHNLITEDFLDLLNILRVYGREGDFIWHHELAGMLHWARTMSHPDGQIALFNDAAFGIAPTVANLVGYAEKLGLSQHEFNPRESAPLLSSGYVRACRGAAVLFADVGPVGPDYQPGHGHADTLSFELSLYGRRVMVDSGTSIYEKGPERLRQRGTGAHNTLQIDEENSSEVWASFRVARRAKIRDLRAFPPTDQACNLRDSAEALKISAAHDGYERLRGVGLHRRQWKLSENHLEILDAVEGRGEHEIRFAFHLHPTWRAAQIEANRFEIMPMESIPELKKPIVLEMESPFAPQISSSSYHPEFGLAVPNQKIVGTFRGILPMKFVSRIRWP